MSLTKTDADIAAKALAFAKQNKKPIARRLTDPEKYQPEENPVSVFMAGSPGAGKTEASKALIADLQSDGGEILRIDPDDLRAEFEDYTGENSYLFQSAVSILVEKLHDFAIKQKQSFILDGTLSNYSIAEKNIKRSLDKKRFVQILYVYQEPGLAWEFVVAREHLEGRKIPEEQFIEQYFAARDVVNSLKGRFGKKIQVDLLLKNIDGSNRVYEANIDKIDNFVPEKYTKYEVETIIRTK
jgi:UDP-N-acetylglucosamine kinase